MSGPVIVTRPAAPGRRLADRLRQCGRQVTWWPAFDIAPAADEGAVRNVLSRLATYRLALFVSPNAVQATAACLSDEWPAETLIGAVGDATREAVMAELHGASTAKIIAPAAGDESGSEGFWRAWQSSGLSADRVLILRAATGRDWIVDRLRTTGATVDVLAVYDRRPHLLSDSDTANLRAWIGTGAVPVTIVSSTEAPAAILEQVRGTAGAVDWLRSGVAVATHPRVAERLHAAGFARVEICSADDLSVVGKLESISG
jgi:uroporphyrinogen-III synthase